MGETGYGVSVRSTSVGRYRCTSGEQHSWASERNGTRQGARCSRLRPAGCSVVLLQHDKQAAKTANSQRAVHASCHSLSSVRGSAVLLPLAERVLLGFDLQHIGPVPCTSLRVRRVSHCPSGSRMYASISVPEPLVRWNPCRVRCARACLLCAIGQLVVCDIGRSEESLNEVHTSGK